MNGASLTATCSDGVAPGLAFVEPLTVTRAAPFANVYLHNILQNNCLHYDPVKPCASTSPQPRRFFCEWHDTSNNTEIVGPFSPHHRDAQRVESMHMRWALCPHMVL